MGKIVIYQILSRLYTNNNSSCIPDGTIDRNGCGKMNHFTEKVLKEIKKAGYTHIWFTGIIAHASKTDYSEYGIPASHRSTVKGNAGSPYAIRDYYDIDPDLAENVAMRMQEFESLVERVHKCHLKFIMDFVPNHVAREYKSVVKPQGIEDLGESDNTGHRFNSNNNFYYIHSALGGEIDWQDYKEEPARATGNDRFSAYPTICDWYETVKLNYGVDYQGNSTCHFNPVPNTWIKMTQILQYWADKHIDAFRCDMAEMVPVEFWEYAIHAVKKRHRQTLFIAEVYNPGLYSSYIKQGGFDYLYDKVGMYDTLRGIASGRESANAITRCWQNLGTIGSHMLHFMENHDEQRIASDFFAGDPLPGKAPMIVSACIDTCPVMVYAGQELGERGMDAEGFSGCDGRTTIFDYWCVDTLKRWYNNGNPSDRQLTAQERELRLFYSGLMNIAAKEKAIAKGLFFDLQYVNPYSDNYNPHKQYSFLRKAGNELILAVVNFDSKPVRTGVVIPAHAFDYLEITQPGAYICTDLLTKTDWTVNLYADRPINLTVPAFNAILLKFTLPG